MTQKEKNILRRCYKILGINGVNWKNTNQLPGLASYYKEASEKIDKIRKVLFYLYEGENYKGEIEEILSEIENKKFDNK